MTDIIFISATGTDIGKTYVTCLLLKQLREKGYKVRALKPIISGFDDSALDKTDSGQLLAAMGIPITLDNIKKISPWRFKEPLPPHLASAQAGKPLNLDEIVDFCQEQLAKFEDKPDFLLIEGAGGVMVPLNTETTLLDLMARLNCSCLMVSGSYLGTLSHTLTALSCLEQRKIPVKGVVLCQSIQSYTDFTDVFEDFVKFIPHIPLKKLARDDQSNLLSMLLD